MTELNPKTFDLKIDHGVATCTWNRPGRLNALTFEVYREMTDAFIAMNERDEIRSVVLTGAGKGFCSGGDQHEIIAELFSRDMQGMLEFTRMTGELVGAIRRLRRPVIAAINGICVGAGAVLAAACDLRIAAQQARFGYIFPRVGLCGADMGAGVLLPRIVGLGNASELLFLGEIIDSAHALRIGLVNRVVDSPEACVQQARTWAIALARGPAFAHGMTKELLEQTYTMDLGPALAAEARAQAICMQHPDFRCAHEAFRSKTTPRFAGSEDAWKE